MELWGMSLENVYVEWNRNAYQEWKAERAPNLWEEKARREFEIDEAIHTEKVTHIKSDAARERQKKDSQQEISELSELMKIKEMMNQQKIDREKSLSDSELEIEKVLESDSYQEGDLHINELNSRLSAQKGIKVEFDLISEANHFFSKSEKILIKSLTKYISKESALY